MTKLNRRMLDKAQKAETTAIFDGISVMGSVKGSRNLYLNGQFEGTIDLTALLLVGKTGKLKGKVKAEYVIIEGEVEGKVVTHEKVELRDGGKFKGEILAPAVKISDNSFFDGKVQMLKEEEIKEKAEKEEVVEEKEEVEAVTPPQVEEIDIKDQETMKMKDAREIVKKTSEKLWTSPEPGEEERPQDFEIEFPLPHKKAKRKLYKT